MYEEIFLVVEGRGTTEVWLDGDTKKHVFEWQKGSMFSIPMNAWHRIVNATSGGALLLAGTTAPNVLNMINNVEAVFNNPFVFRDRFTGADDFFKAEGRHRARSRCAASPCGAPTSSPTSSTATCRSTTAARSAGAASSRS